MPIYTLALDKNRSLLLAWLIIGPIGQWKTHLSAGNATDVTWHVAWRFTDNDAVCTRYAAFEFTDLAYFADNTWLEKLSTETCGYLGHRLIEVVVGGVSLAAHLELISHATYVGAYDYDSHASTWLPCSVQSAKRTTLLDSTAQHCYNLDNMPINNAYCLSYPVYTIEQTSSRHGANVEQTSSKHRANIELARPANY